MNGYQNIINNQKELFLDWYREFYPMVRKLVLEMTGSKEALEDIFQDTLIVIWEKVRNNELILTSKLSTYLYSIAKNKCREHLRERRKESTEILDDDFNIIEETAYDKTKDILIKQLELCIEKLPETRKKIIRDYYYFKYKMETIAEKRHLKNADSIKTQKYKAIIDLKECLQKSKLE